MNPFVTRVATTSTVAVLVTLFGSTAYAPEPEAAPAAVPTAPPPVERLFLSFAEAVRQLKTWMDSGMAPMVMAVDLSILQFRHSNLPEQVSKILREEGLPPQYLELELTEGVAMDDPPKAIAVMGKLHESGVCMAIDDFGSGYSSLAHLKRFQVYKLKIDRSFISDITEDPENKAIVSAIISMANVSACKRLPRGWKASGSSIGCGGATAITYKAI